MTGTTHHYVANRIAASPLLDPRLRRRLLCLVGHDIRTDNIQYGVHFASREVAVGPRSFIGHATYFDGTASVTVGADVAIGDHVTILTGDHEIGPASRRAGALRRLPVTIDDGAWIGARSVILAGVTVGAGCIVAAGSVVTSSCEPNGLYAGVPATRKRELPI